MRQPIKTLKLYYPVITFLTNIHSTFHNLYEAQNAVRTSDIPAELHFPWRFFYKTGFRCYGFLCLMKFLAECFNYTLLNDSTRARTYYEHPPTNECDHNLLAGWYRFGRGTGNQMADTCRYPMEPHDTF